MVSRSREREHPPPTHARGQPQLTTNSSTDSVPRDVRHRQSYHLCWRAEAHRIRTSGRSHTRWVEVLTAPPRPETQPPRPSYTGQRPQLEREWVTRHPPRDCVRFTGDTP